jgi:ABC-type transport system involved in cytochrome bd biosynthesis fused ATPase/permease subunit
MKGKTKLIAMAISLVFFLVLIGAGWFSHHNPITLWIGAFFLFFYFPVHFWDAHSRMKSEQRQEKLQADIDEAQEALRKATETFIKGLKDDSHDE